MIKISNIKKKEPYDVYIGRENKWLNLPASKWANPFVMKKEVERIGVLANYEAYVRSRSDLMNSLDELDWKILGCYCHPKKCHGDVLIKLHEEKYRNVAQSVRAPA